MCSSGECHSGKGPGAALLVSVQISFPFSQWVFVVRALLTVCIWRVEVGVGLGLEGSHLLGRIMCGLRAGAEILSTCFMHFRGDLFSTPNYLPELFSGDPISTACFLSFPIRRAREKSEGPKTNILTLPETKFHTLSDLLWFSKKQAAESLPSCPSLCPEEAWLQLGKQTTAPLSNHSFLK